MRIARQKCWAQTHTYTHTQTRALICRSSFVPRCSCSLSCTFVRIAQNVSKFQFEQRQNHTRTPLEISSHLCHSPSSLLPSSSQFHFISNSFARAPLTQTPAISFWHLAAISSTRTHIVRAPHTARTHTSHTHVSPVNFTNTKILSKISRSDVNYENAQTPFRNRWLGSCTVTSGHYRIWCNRVQLQIDSYLQLSDSMDVILIFFQTHRCSPLFNARLRW